MESFTFYITNSCYYNRRAHIPNPAENFNSGNILLERCGMSKQHPRPPFAVLAQNARNADNNSIVSSVKDTLINVNDTDSFI